jgi:two-component SAPR family response regulator
LYKLRAASRAVTTLSRKELEEVSSLYSGDYLEGKAYDWAAVTRTQMESEYKTIQSRIADAYFSSGELKQACVELRKILAHNPYDEETVERLISIYIAMGDTLNASNLYQEFEMRLKKEMRLCPSNRLKALLSSTYHMVGNAQDIK